MKTHSPPRLAEWLLERYLDGDAREAIAGDMAEEYEWRRERGSRIVAALWYWHQAFRSLLASRASRPARPARKGDPLMTAFVQDLRFAVRALRGRPGFAAVTLSTLSLGIGSATAIFSVVHAVLLRPLPYHDESRVVMVWETEPAEGTAKKVGTPGNFQDWLAQNHTVDHLSGLSKHDATLTGVGEPRRLEGRRVSASLFAALGVRPFMGRPFVADDEISGRDVVLLSHHVWQEVFGGDPSVVGARIALDDHPRTIVGVMAPAFRLPRQRDDFWIPLVFTPWERQARGSHWLMAVGRLKPGVTLAQAQADMDVIAQRLASAHPRFNAREGLLVEPIREELVAELRRPLAVLMAAVSILMGIASINVASLLLARANGRRQEMAVRVALGAGRMRLVRQLLTESLLLGALGSLGGIGLSWGAVRTLPAFLPERLAGVGAIALKPEILGFAIALAVMSGLLFGLAPVLLLSRRPPGSLINDAARVAADVRVGGAGRALVAAEMALAVVLLVAASLLIRSFARLSAVDPGFHPDSVLTFRLELPRSRYPDPSKWAPMLDELMARLESLPGVVAAGAISWLPLTTAGGSNALFVEGEPLPAPGDATYVLYRMITPGYFRALGIPLLAGRAFDTADGARSQAVVVINQRMAVRYWPGESPIGRRVSFARTPKPEDWMTVVGVVGDSSQGTLDAPIDIEMFAPHTQEANWFPPSAVALRTSGEPLALAAAVRDQVQAVDPLMPVSDVRTLEAVVARSVAPARFNTGLVAVFSAVALVLSAVGVYGLLSFSVGARSREIGVRTALGARPGEISRLVVKEGLILTCAGIALGLPAAFGLARVLRTLLYDTAPTDPGTFVAVPALMLVVALAACYLPARRAARLDPVAAMRE
jgi:putative ABC transport system permease protein